MSEVDALFLAVTVVGAACAFDIAAGGGSAKIVEIPRASVVKKPRKMK